MGNESFKLESFKVGKDKVTPFCYAYVETLTQAETEGILKNAQQTYKNVVLGKMKNAQRQQLTIESHKLLSNFLVVLIICKHILNNMNNIFINSHTQKINNLQLFVIIDQKIQQGDKDDKKFFYNLFSHFSNITKTTFTSDTNNSSMHFLYSILSKISDNQLQYLQPLPELKSFIVKHFTPNSRYRRYINGVKKLLSEGCGTLFRNEVNINPLISTKLDNIGTFKRTVLDEICQNVYNESATSESSKIMNFDLSKFERLILVYTDKHIHLT